MNRGLGPELFSKMRETPVMLAVEYVGKKVSGMVGYYRDMQEIVWAMLEEGFSGRVVTPGVTTTEVRNIPLSPK